MDRCSGFNLLKPDSLRTNLGVFCSCVVHGVNKLARDQISQCKMYYGLELGMQINTMLHQGTIFLSNPGKITEEQHRLCGATHE